ncbi:cofilin/actin-depolymerizing factor homolog [Plakobranchus ocellatus]|uniref:Cofilin/actin-depolymerizing factor homolog n=1 Tax=Plakobranchus ocellatus TaxID=259542 RepID=A0AAV4ANJ3_9GAST|nr:cofilin/actin-depolymerizing factor homolog [Plakobranchus ocellatus]
MATGVTVADETVELYKSFKLRKTNYRFVVMFIDEDGLIKADLKIDKNKDLSQEEEYNKFLDLLPQNVGRYIMIDLNIPQKNGALKDIMFLVSWNPDGASMKSNMLYTASKKALTEKIREGMIDIQANDLSDISYQEVMVKGCK